MNTLVGEFHRRIKIAFSATFYKFLYQETACLKVLFPLTQFHNNQKGVNMQRKGLIILLVFLFPVLMFAQGTMVVKGKVTDNTGEPLIGANVKITKLSLGAATDINGKYQFEIPKAMLNRAEVELIASFIGYKSKSVKIVLGGGTLDQDFFLEEDVFQSEEIVVTGVASKTSKAVADVAVARVNADALTSKQLYQGVNQLLAGKVAGVQMQQASGNVGGGFRFYVRGGGGLNGNQQPVIFVDGVKVSDLSFSGYGAGGQDMNVLANLNPNDIENIEFLKGPAASATYGTSGSNGVVLITTKKGKLGSTVSSGMNVNYRFTYGFNERSFLFKNEHFVTADEANAIYRRGVILENSVNLTGGNATLRYFTSFLNRKEDGVINNNASEKNSFRVNVTSLPTNELSLTFTSSYTENVLRRPVNDNSVLGYMGNTLLRGVSYTFTPKEAIDAMSDINRNNQFIGGIQAVYKPFANFEVNANIGVDQLDWKQEQVQPYGLPYLGDTGGQRSLFNVYNRNLNYDFNVKYFFSPVEKLNITTIVGSQITDSKYKRDRIQVQSFTTNKLDDIGAGTSVTDKSETKTHNREAGIFWDNQLNYNDTYIASFAIRKDYASSVGSDAPSIIYPKFSAAVRLDKFDVLPDFVNLFKFRIAYGETGVLPAATDAINLLWSGQSGGYGAGATVFSLGNTALKPERMKELEVGFDAEFMKNLSVEFTYYKQDANESIVFKNNAPSTGFGAYTSPFNVGSVANSGFEAMIQYKPIITPDYDLSMSLIWNYQTNEVKSLGGQGAIYANDINVYKEGLAKHEFHTFKINGAKFDAAGKYLGPDVTAERFAMGNPIPAHNGSFTINFRFLRNFSFYAMADWGLKNKIYNMTKKFSVQFGGFKEYNDLNALLKTQTVGSTEYRATAEQLARLDRRYPGNFIEDADFFVLRELSLSYDFSEVLAQVFENNPLKNITAGVSVRNVWRTSKYKTGDFEVNYNGGRGNIRGTDFLTLPNPRTVNFWISLGL